MTRTATSATAQEVLDYGPVLDRTTRFDGGYTVNWTTFREAIDMAPVLAQLPGGRCSCPHWGQLLSGRVVVHYEDHDDVIEAGQAYYMAPGHVPEIEAGTEFLMFSPTEELSATEAAIDAAAARQAAATAQTVNAGAQEDARAARAASDQAANDAALAGRAADQAERDAAVARKAAEDATRAATEASNAATRAGQDAAAAAQAATLAQQDAEAARQAAARAEDHARDAESAAVNAEKSAVRAEERARNADADAKDIQEQLAQLQEELRRAAEEEERREAEEAINEDEKIPALTPEEENDLRGYKGQAGVDDYNRARADANRDLLGLIVDEGGQVLLDLIGYTDAKRCFMEGDFIACVMTVINVLPIAKIGRFLSQIPDAINAAVRIVKGIKAFKNVKQAARKLVGEAREVLRQLKRCRTQPGKLSACDVVDPAKVRERELAEHSGQPKVNPQFAPALRSVASQKFVNGCFGTAIPADTPVNYAMEPFKWLGADKLRATGGVVCAKSTTTRSGEPATPVGHPADAPAKIGTDWVDKGHLVAARLHGKNDVSNIVTQYLKVNRSDVKRVENAVAGMLDYYVGRDISVVYEVHVQYASITAAKPAWIFIEALSSDGRYCFAEIRNEPLGNPVKQDCSSFRARP